jgi:hypothetical protein
VALYDRPTWRERRAILSAVCRVLFGVAVIIGATAAIYFFYPFVPIRDVPIGELTLNQISTDLFGALLLIVVPVHFGLNLRTVFINDLNDRERRAVEMVFVVGAFTVVGIGILSWFVPLSRWLSE